MRRRLQFSLRFLLVVVLAVCCFLAGAVWQKHRDEPEWIHRAPPAGERQPNSLYVEHMRMPDGTVWSRSIQDEFSEEPPKSRKAKAPVPDDE